MLVAEMLKGVPDEVFEIIASIFILRLLNHPGVGKDDAWDIRDIHLLEKCFNPKTMRKWRPIALLPVLWKLYMHVLAELGKIDEVQISENQFYA